MSAYIIPISAASLLLIVVAVIVLRYALTPRIVAPLCGHCRYDVTGLPTDICPECGANLNVVGILQPGSVRPMSAWMNLALWTLCVAAIGVIATPPILNSIPPLQQMNSSATLSQPRTRLYDSVAVNGVRTWRGKEGEATSTVDVTLKRLDGQTYTMQASPERGLCWYTDNNGRTQRGELPGDDADAAARSVLTWMNSCGLAASEELLLPEANEIAMTIKQAGDRETVFQGGGRLMFGSMNGSMNMQSRTFSFGSSGSGSNRPRSFAMTMGPYAQTAVNFTSGTVSDPWPKRLVIAGWGALWLIGMLMIVVMTARWHPGEPAQVIEAPQPIE